MKDKSIHKKFSRNCIIYFLLLICIYYSRMICELLLHSRKLKIFIYLSLFNYSNLPFFSLGETRRSQVEWNLYKT